LGLDHRLRERILEAAVTIGRAAGLENLATIEFLVDADGGRDATFAFIEANPRLQVEHTVTEEVIGLDLVGIQLELASGRTLHELGLDQEQVPAPRGAAIEVRINMETMMPDGTVRPAGGTLTAFEPPSGAGIRVDTCGFVGYRPSPRFDSLLGKLIVCSRLGGHDEVAAKACRALTEFKIEGVPTNAALLHGILRHPEFLTGHIHTGFIEAHGAELIAPFSDTRADVVASAGRVGARVDPNDPLA